MQSGRLRHRVEVQKPVVTVNDYNEAVRSWLTLDTRWAAVEPLRGAERVAGQQMESQTTHRIILRYVEVGSEYRIKWEDRIFNIVEVINRQERDIETEIMAIEVDREPEDITT